MINISQFLDLVSQSLSIQLNPNQYQAIQAPLSRCLFIVAGPGSGKTTVLALRVLRFIFVDGVEPRAILATTFTRKAAKELHSRILDLGDKLRNELMANTSNQTTKQALQRLDINAVVTGTLDSIAESVLTGHRPPGAYPPIVIEEFVAKNLILRRGLFQGGRYQDQDLRDYICQLRNGAFGLNPATLAEVVKQIKERFLHDLIDRNQYMSTSPRSCAVCGTHPHPGIKVVCEAIRDYEDHLNAEGVVDFSGLEQRFLQELQSGALDRFANSLKAVLVDEYQDTNLLQEQIYFELARRVHQTGGGITVVGDDDQSLFRFRGATVDLFQNFPQRLRRNLQLQAQTVFLAENYRSTPCIVDFCNDFIQLDSAYQSARVRGKPPIVSARSAMNNIPILGMFRDNLNMLARDLAHFINSVFRANGFHVPGLGRLERSHSGSVGDCALLCHSPREVDSNGNLRLPGQLRHELSNYGIQVFNPRGRHLASVPEVERLCGLMLECIDPSSRVQNSINNLPPEAVNTFNRWRQRARTYIDQNPHPQQPNSLAQFVQTWQQRSPQGRHPWPQEINLSDLVYKLVTWIPEMQDDIEGLVYLEVVLRAITAAASARVSRYGGSILFQTPYEENSIRSAYWDVFVPIALGALEVDEDLLETLPKDRLNILSIHQAKGLEFPMVIVDAGSDYRRDHPRQRFKRFPDDGDLTHNLEDELRQFSPLGLPARSRRDRAFDDLIRLYFVAFSRAQDVLLLVGLNSVQQSIPNVATGWDRNRNWHWGQGLPNLVHI